MDSDALGSIDDFFDFDQLDPHQLGAFNESHNACFDGFALPSFELGVEWPAAPALPPAAVQYVEPRDLMRDSSGQGASHDIIDCPSSPIQEYGHVFAPVEAISQPGACSLGLEDLCLSTSALHAVPISEPSINDAPSSPPQSLRKPQEAKGARSRKQRQIPAKRRNQQSRLPPEARQILEEKFSLNPYPCSWELDIIAHQTKLDIKRVRTWFNNTRARKEVPRRSEQEIECDETEYHQLAPRLSHESLEALANQDEDVPQPPLEAYLASSYRDEAAAVSAIRAAIDTFSPLERTDTTVDSSSASRAGKASSVITSLTSSDGSAPTSYTMSSNSSNVSSFGRERRRGRRRTTWRNSPYGSAKLENLYYPLPKPDLPFFCTFCPRSFKTKYEWTRHEDSVHALRTTWVCCNTKQDKLSFCPFCGQLEPDDYHMASHNYQQCRNKPETQRTFFRRDHFIQHLHHVHFRAKHPSTSLGCQARLSSDEGHDYGCKDLAMKWRNFGAPMRTDDPMLHCGFCGKISQDWSARCQHVAEHLIEGSCRRSSWWPARAETQLENLCVPQTIGPFRCRYCFKVFTNAEAIAKHTHCQVWSCRFLDSFDAVASESNGPPLCPQFPSPKAHHCHLCGAGYKSTTSHIDHAQQYHSYRQCGQEMYSSEQEFLQHLHESHGASSPALLLQRRAIITRNFTRKQPSAFEAIDFDEMMQGCREEEFPSRTFVDPFTDEDPAPFDAKRTAEKSPEPPVQRRKKTRDRLSEMADIPAKVQRKRARKASEAETESQGPRFFRLDPIVPFLSSRIYFLRNAKTSNLLSDGSALLEEMPHSHIASLVMSSGLLGMAGVRFPVQMKKDEESGLVELALED
ncbi:hypothetical protein EJ04DRAFT_527467 [Polyplosphaeria fusca]|uniref:Uncharacterized protein n=1 Tax=Polyplosphaeria fusca TaxID=682080 RepID=A0A9P4QQK2_9PLEO|nr:hypothetical protein EJ04DRAFT_527467 [Polyplosphaeria fusca]